MVFTLKRSSMETIFRSLNDLKDKTLLEFNKDEVRQIKILKPEQTFVLKKFEKEFSRFIDKKYSVAVSSGTAALEIAIKALDIKKNDEVLIPNFTIISNALAVIRQQAKPVLIDCNLKDWNIKIEDVEKNISKKTKAIIITHIYSFPNEMTKNFKNL